jgi:hypothetical protein
MSLWENKTTNVSTRSWWSRRPRSKHAQELKALASNVQGGQIDDCGYYVMDERPENVAQKLLDFYHNQNFCPTSSSLSAHNFAAAVGSLAHGAGSPI